MFARYLQRTVEPIQIGYYERVAKSALQYAESLLAKHKGNLANSPDIISDKLVYGYQDHGFVIDKEEAESIFGADTVKSNTSEYSLGNSVYNVFSRVESWAEIFNQNFYFIGSVNSAPSLWAKPKK